MLVFGKEEREKSKFYLKGKKMKEVENLFI
jgi:hypothetical protein